MRYLIDTNILIKITNDTDSLSDNVKAIIENYENIVFVSSASVTEYIHLLRNGKVLPNKELRMLNVFDMIKNKLGFRIKYIAEEHLQTFAKLEVMEGHNDPNDHLIIAQAITEKMSLISSDKKFPKYRKMGLELIVSH